MINNNCEQKLFFLLSIDADNTPAIQDIFKSNAIDYYTLLGYLCFNRLAGLVYSNIRKYQYEIPNDQFLFALENMFNAQKIRCNILRKEIQLINSACMNKDFPFALLKGSILSATIYQDGQRVSNDIDILINSGDITNLTDTVKSLGYIQGEYDIGTSKIIIPTRREIVYRRMNWGEAFPLVKTFKKDIVKFLEIDINFSISWVPEDGSTVKEMLSNTASYGESNLQSLSLEDFLIHLLMHLYKELILFDCVEVMRDMEFYKFIDIVRFFESYSKKLNVDSLYEKIEKFSLENYIYTALLYIKNIFEDYVSIPILDTLLSYLECNGAKIEDTIQVPEKQKKYSYKGSFMDRIFDPCRVNHLQEQI